MKNTFLILLGIATTFLLGFQSSNYITKTSTAEVSKVNELYIFTDSRPVSQFDSLGTVEIGFITGTQYETIRTNLIKRTKEKFPSANAIILKFDKKGIDKCEAIKLR